MASQQGIDDVEGIGPMTSAKRRAATAKERRFLPVWRKPGATFLGPYLTDPLRAVEELRNRYETLLDTAREQLCALTAAQANLARTDHELHTLASSVSHDLRAPLRAILGYSGMLSEDLEAGRIEEVIEHAFRIERAARRMDQMIGALSRLSRAAHHALQLTSVDMAMQAREAWSMLTAAEPARQPTLLICELPPAIGDGQLLAQVWQNLLANAIKYSARTAEAKVRVDAFAQDGRQWYRVTDNGVGFDMNDAKHLFEPFRRLHAESDFAGIGIGLSIVRRIVRRHGGEIRARGNVGAGAVFEFTLEGDAVSETAAATIVA